MSSVGRWRWTTAVRESLSGNRSWGPLADPRGPSWRRGGPYRGRRRSSGNAVEAPLWSPSWRMAVFRHTWARFLVGGVGGGWSPPSCPCAPRLLSRGLSRVKGPISSSTAPPPTCCASLGNLLPASEPVPRSPARGAGLIPPGSVQSPGQTGKREKMGVT